MTDRKPDDLYDALRDRLANYGQEPPAPLWAEIRAQLPSPTAQPQLRQRRRQRVALLALLLLLVSVGGWQWWRRGLQISRHGAEMAVGRAADSSAPAVTLHPGVSPDKEEEISATTGPRALPPAAPNEAQSATAISPATTPVATPEKASMAVASSVTNNSSAQEKAAKTWPQGIATKSATTAKSVTRRTIAVGPAMAGNEGRAARGYSRRTRAARGAAVVAVAKEVANQTGALPNQQALVLPPARATARNAWPTTAQSLEIKPLASPSTAASAADLAAEEQAGTPSSFAAWHRLLPRRIALNPLAWAIPALRADTLPPPAASVARRWAVQVLAGPALTYRVLGTRQGTSTAVRAGVSFADASGNSTSVEQQERPAVGMGALVQLRRALSGRWSVSTGVGYQEYATELAFQTVRAAANSSSPTSSAPVRLDSAATAFNLRNTYRLLTIPVRIGYQLGVGGPRFRLGVLAGADVALYLGGATAENSACGCQTQTWGRINSPYRPLSLALNLGLDLRYRLAPRWEVLAQPTATYFPTPLARSGTGLAPRYLLGGGAQFGVSYGLH